MKTRSLLFLTCLVAAASMACTKAADTGSPAGSTATTRPGSGATTYVGRVANTDLAVAGVIEGDRVLLYVCDGRNGRRFDGTLGSDGYTANIEGLGTMKVALAGNALTGSLEAGGTSYPIRADAASGKAALLWASGQKDGAPVSAGWIVAPDGSETGGVVSGITDGTSNLVLNTGNLPRTSQDGIIAILIGVRSPVTSVSTRT